MGSNHMAAAFLSSRTLVLQHYSATYDSFEHHEACQDSRLIRDKRQETGTLEIPLKPHPTKGGNPPHDQVRDCARTALFTQGSQKRNT